MAGGIEGGLAAADILCGDVNPSGKLTDTFAQTLEDYPSSEGFHESLDYVNYEEDVYVGYRYFESFPQAKAKVIYPFGYGLSYTEFEICTKNISVENDQVRVKAEVTNLGLRPGKEVVQVYYSAPQGKLGKPALELGGFQKTRLLAAGETQTMILTFSVSDMASLMTWEKSASQPMFWKGKLQLLCGKFCRESGKVERRLGTERRPYCQPADQ